MVDKRLSLPETAIMLILMAEAREMANTELRDRFRLPLDGKSRRKLNDLKLVDSWRQGRQYVHVLTDAGWRWCQEELVATAPPPNSGSAGMALYAVLNGLGRHLDRTDLRVAEIFFPLASQKVATPNPPVDTRDLETRVRAIYADLARSPGDPVRLLDLRKHFGDVTKDQLDQELVRMNRMGDVFLHPESVQGSLTEADREAAVNIGDQDKHLIAIGG